LSHRASAGSQRELPHAIVACAVAAVKAPRRRQRAVARRRAAKRRTETVAAKAPRIAPGCRWPRSGPRLRARTGPLIGIGEAAFHLATLIAHRFSVVTTLSRSIAPIEANLMIYGLDRRCARVRACEVPVLALDDPGSGAGAKLSAAIEGAKAQEGAEAIVLGCAGMAELAASLSREHELPVIDGVAAAVKLAEALMALGLVTSKRGPYAQPIPKAFTGVFANIGS
jgi:hypothetical protein